MHKTLKTHDVFHHNNSSTVQPVYEMKTSR